MMTAQVEPWSAALDEMQTLWPEHFAELALNQDKVPLAPRLDRYAKMEQAGTLFVVTLRDVGVLVGYFVGMVDWSLHYGGCLECSMDMFFVRAASRGRFGGLRLFRCAKRELQRRGVQRWHVGSKLHKDASRLFRALGMTPIETYYSQWIGD